MPLRLTDCTPGRSRCAWSYFCSWSFDVLAVHARRYGPRFAAIVAELNARTDVERIGEYGEREKRVAVYQVMKGQ
jgi:hypothetical protein